MLQSNLQGDDQKRYADQLRILEDAYSQLKVRKKPV